MVIKVVKMNKFYFILFFCFILGNSSLYSQDWNKIYVYESDAEYLILDKQFDKAAETFKRAAKLVSENANFKFKIGYCYLNTDDKKKDAISYLEGAILKISDKYNPNSLKEMNAPTEALYLLAEAYRINLQYNEAIETYKKYKEYLKPGDNLIDLIDQNISSCTNASQFIKDSLSVKVTNLGKLINNDLPNTNAVISGDGNTLAYTTITSTGNDVFVANKVKGVWAAPKKITTQLGDKYLLTSFLSYDGKDLYLSSDDPQNCDLLVSTVGKNKWIKALKFKKPINTKYNETHVCLTKDGNTMYFTSDRKGGLGGFDIYKATVNTEGVWGEPVNLGPDINTKFNEATPFLSPDEKYLFFSSEGHEGMGGYDIFFVNLEGTPKVTNLGYPVNNSDNNLFYFPENGWKSGLISFYSKKGLGMRDINQLSISRYTNINGKILAENNGTGSFDVSIFDTEKNDTIAKLKSSTDFSYKVASGSYQVFVKNGKYLPFSQNVSIPEDYINKDFSVEARMQPIPVPKLITLTVDTTSQIKTIAVATTEVAKEKPREIKKTEEVKKSKPPVTKSITKPVTKPITKPITKPVIKPVIKIENSSNINSSVKLTTYAVQLMALREDIGASYFKNIDNIEITTSPDGFYRYSVGSTESMKEAMETLKRVKELGYTNAYVRIDRLAAVYTIQLMAQKNPVDLSTFQNIPGVNEQKGNDGLYRYQVGSFSSILDAKKTLTDIYEAGYKKAFIKKVGVK